MRDNWMDAECICLASDGVRTSGAFFSIWDVSNEVSGGPSKARRFNFAGYIFGKLKQFVNQLGVYRQGKNVQRPSFISETKAYAR